LETYFPHYEACVKADGETLISTFNDISGVPASANHYTLTELLKWQWKHDNFVVSEWEAIDQLIAQLIPNYSKKNNFRKKRQYIKPKRNGQRRF